MISDRSGTPLSAAEIADGFMLLLGRPPESEAVVAHYMALGLERHAFLRVLLGSREFEERQRKRLALNDLNTQAEPWPASGNAVRVLLFGAYGNGNLGDTVQAEALAWLLRQVLPTSPLSFAATSWERQAPFRLPGGAVLPGDVLLRPDRLAPGQEGAARLVAIGGGGLLGAPHFPLHEAAWARWFVARGIPYAFLGVGGAAAALQEPECAEAYRTLLTGAVFVGGRDDATLRAIRDIRPDAAWFPDPVLAWALGHAEPSAAPRPIDLLLIPRFPNSPADAAGNRAMLARRAAAVAGERIVVAALEPQLDAQALHGEAVEYVTDWEALMALCRQARRVVTLRLHGAVAGLAAGCVVHGLVQPKIAGLMHDLGVGRWFGSDQWSEADDAGFHDALRPGLVDFGRRTQAAMAFAGNLIAPAIA